MEIPCHGTHVTTPMSDPDVPMAALVQVGALSQAMGDYHLQHISYTGARCWQ